MQDTIQELIAIDKKARDMVQAAQEGKLRAKAEMEDEKKNISSTYAQQAEQRIEKIKAQARQSATQEAQLLEKNYRAAAERLEESFRQNEERWVREIVRRCKEQ